MSREQDPWWFAEVRAFTRRPLRRIAFLRVAGGWQAVVAGPDNRILPGWRRSEVYSDLAKLAEVARGMHTACGLPLDLSGPLILPRPKNPGGGERIAA